MLFSQLMKTGRLMVVVALLAIVAPVASSVAQSTDNHLVLFGDAAREVPADQAMLQVNLTFSDERDMKVVYEEHRKASQQLTELLGQSNVPAEDIRFFPLMTRRGRDDYRNQPGQRATSYQRVVIELKNISQLENIQRTLTTGGFTDVAVTFSVSNQRDIELQLMDIAIARAQEKATRAAKAVSRTVKRVVGVRDVGENEGFYSYRENFRSNLSQNQASYDNDPFRQMVVVPQLFRFSAVVRVDFELND